jgi:hypothetical protein
MTDAGGPPERPWGSVPDEETQAAPWAAPGSGGEQRPPGEGWGHGPQWAGGEAQGPGPQSSPGQQPWGTGEQPGGGHGWPPGSPGYPGAGFGAPPGYGPPPGYPPAYGAPHGGMPYGAFQQGPKTNGLAIASLIVSIAGAFTFVGAIVGLILGFVARHQIDRSEGRETGSGMALAGIIIGIVVVLGWIAIIALAVANSNNDTYNYNYNSLAHLGALVGTAR